jgi:nucleoside recognition membrane protein YjiH
MSGLKPNVYLGVSVSASMLFSGLYVPGAAYERANLFSYKITILHVFDLPGTLKGFCKSDFVPNVYLGVSLRASRLFSGLYVPGAAETSKIC